MKNISVREFLELQDQTEYLVVLNNLKPKDVFPEHTFNLNNLTYNEVRKINRLCRKVSDLKDHIDIIATAYQVEEFKVYDLPIINFFHIKKFIEEKILNLAKKESDILGNASGDADMWKMAGGDSLKQYADVLPLDRLAKMYGGYPLDYGEKKYVEIIYLLAMNSQQSKVESKFNELKYQQKKR